MKTCRTCGLEKPYDEFYNNGRGAHVSTCKPCYRAVQNAPHRQDTRRVQLRQKNTGLDLGQQKCLHTSQDGLCGMCGVPVDFNRGCLDHDHTTMTARGFLCPDCNSGLGLIGDTLEAAERAVAYLKQPPAARLFSPASPPSARP